MARDAVAASLSWFGASSAERIRQSARLVMDMALRPLYPTKHAKAILSLMLGAVALAAVAYLGLFVDLPSPDALITRSSPDTTKILDRNGSLLFEVLDPRAGQRTRVRLEDLPTHLLQAVVSVEDAGFYDHPGVDVVGVARAAAQAIRDGELVSGGSTITQQLARNLLLSQAERDSRTLARKVREMYLALRLTQSYSKATILEMYLNEIYFGQLAYGVEAAARNYFGKPARELDLAESALLAGIIQAPSAYDPLVNLEAALARQQVVLGLMVKQGRLNQDQADQARAEPLHFVAGRPASATLLAPHFVSYALAQLETRFGAELVNRGGLVVTTTLDLDLQRQAEEAVRQQLAELARQSREEGAPDLNVHNAALVALEPFTGEILAMVGSADYWDASIDGAVNVSLASRQPGSAIKPVTYAAAFANGLTPASVFNDVPATFITREGQPYAPQNYDRLWHGPISLRQALATSSNMVAVRVLDRIGLPAMMETAQALGISTLDEPDRFGLALTLGGGEVRLLELTAAYATLANSGVAVPPRAILSVRQGDSGAPMDARAAQVGARAVSPQVAYLVADILSDDAARMPAFGEDSVLQLNRPAAAKTGTTTDFRDNWTLGFTPDLAVGVWAGNADNQPMTHSSGITGAAPIWHSFMDAALRDRPALAFARPTGLVDAEVCESSGLLATADCARRRTEVFIAGTEPVQYDDTYRRLALEASSGLLWAEVCQGPRRDQVFRLLPAEALSWGAQQGISQPPTTFCDGRPAGVAPDPDSAARRQGDPVAVLSVTFPDEGTIIAASPQVPAAMQQLELTASAEVAMSQVTITVDGAAIATSSHPPYRATWQIAPGDHLVRALGLDANGATIESAPIAFRVEAGERESR
jgi:1A family penicillin-binding protein